MLSTHARLAIMSAIVVGALATSPQKATAAPQCFTAFGGTVTYMFNAKVTTKNALSGRVFGALSSCAGLNAWPLVGSAFKNAANTKLTLAFRAMVVDAASCGATDNIVTLSLPALSGSLQLHNDRNNFSNSSSFSVVACPASPPPAVMAPVTVGQDAFGNDGE